MPGSYTRAEQGPRNQMSENLTGQHPVKQDSGARREVLSLLNGVSYLGAAWATRDPCLIP
jgi:hypothetical protein